MPGESLALTGIVLAADGSAAAGAIVETAGGHRGRTDDRGRFALDGLQPGAHVVQATRGDAASSPARIHIEPDTQPIVLQLFDAANLSLSVVDDASQAPIAGARVRVVSRSYGDPLIREGITNAQGRLELGGLTSDSYAVVATADGYQGVEQPLPPRAGLRWSHELQLRRGAAVHGRVIDNAGRPVVGAGVAVFPADAVDHFVPLAYRGALDVETDQHGRFVVPAVAPGAFRVRAAHPSFLPGWSAALASDGATPVTGIAIELAAGAAVAGRVTTSDGVPAANATVRVGTVDAVAAGGARTATCDGAGRFHIAGLPRTAVDVVASTPHASSEPVRVDLTARGAPATDLVIPLAYDLAIAGTVVDPDERPIPGATVVCVGEPDGAIGTRPVAPETTDAAGWFACRGLPPGSYELTAMKPGGNNNTGPWQRSAGAAASAGDADVMIMIPNDGGLRAQVRTADGAVPASFGVELDVGGLPRVFEAGDGELVLEGLAPRTYTLVVTAPGQRAAIPVTIPEDGVVDLGTVTLQPLSGGTTRAQVFGL